MRLNSRLAPLYSMADEDAGGGGGAPAPEPAEAKPSDSPTFTKEDLDKAIAQATKGLDSKNKELLGKLKERQQQLEQWGDLDPDRVKSVLEQFDSNEEMKLLAEGKHDEVINRRMEKVAAQYDSKIDGLSQEKTTLEQQLEAANNQIRDLLIDSRVVTAFNGEQGLESAVPDVVFRAKSVFRVEDGDVVARDANGELMRGKNGPLTIQEWVADLKDKAPHLFPGSGGGGATGGRAAGGGDFDSRMIAAAQAGDMKEYRKLRAAKEKARLAANE